jgi:hypothetical protein
MPVYHSFKRLLFSGPPSEDPAFDALCLGFRDRVSDLRTARLSLLKTNGLMKAAAASLDDLQGKLGATVDASTYLSQVDVRKLLDVEIAASSTLEGHMVERRTLLREADYYRHKIRLMDSDRQLRRNDGKVESKRDLDLWERNALKLHDAESKFLQHHASLEADLQDMQARHGEILRAAGRSVIAEQQRWLEWWGARLRGWSAEINPAGAPATVVVAASTVALDPAGPVLLSSLKGAQTPVAATTEPEYKQQKEEPAAPSPQEATQHEPALEEEDSEKLSVP